MKRYISLSCILLFLVACVASPVSAADLISETRFNLMDYWQPTLFSVTEGNNYIDIALPQSMPFGSFDFVVNAPGGLDSVSILYNSNTYPLTLDPIGSGYYRVYGFDYDILFHFSDSITLVFDCSSALYLNFISAFASYTPLIQFDIDAYCNILASDYDKTIHFVPTDDINYRIFTSTENYNETWFTCYIWTDNWRKYDLIDYQFLFDVQAITSVSAMMGSSNIDLTVSNYNSTSIEGDSFMLSLSMDVTDLNRNSSDYPMIIVMGRLDPGVLNSIDFVNCSGLVYQSQIDSELSFFSKIINRLDLLSSTIQNQFNSYFSDLFYALSVYNNNLNTWILNHTSAFQAKISEFETRIDLNFSYLGEWLSHYTSILEAAIRGDTAPGDSFQQEVGQKDQQLNDMAVVMESVDQPDLNSVNVSANSYVDSTVLAASMSGITSVFSQGLYFDVILMSIMMATAGYVLFGKR